MNEEHDGFKPHEKTIELWRDWLRKGGLEEESLSKGEEQLRICYRHFKHNSLGVSGSGEFMLYLTNPDVAVPKLYPWDKKDTDDQIIQYEISKRLENSMDVKRKPAERPKRIRNRKRTAQLDSSIDPKKKKTDYSSQPRKLLNFNVLLQTASTIDQDALGVHRLVPYAPVPHNLNPTLGEETNLAMCEIREALLRHDWNLALKLLPSIFMKKHTLQFIWRAYLQIFCHHPDSNPEMLHQLLGMCFNTMSITGDQLKKVFCLPKDIEHAGNALSKEEKFRMCPTVYKKASVIHKLEQNIPDEKLKKYVKYPIINNDS
ncbi:Hypothetical predicted protein [Cloeon dipterum]|uniref:Uncharacterized protein n=1 Tax=Cloeon dipterum TaxID=197152 RepID=A0A8S1CRF9_9INSE|nr:Hypothetical predicted protein [Cloeon dipterum]